MRRQRHPTELIGWLKKLGVVEVPESLSVSVETQHYCRPTQDDDTPEKYPDFLIRLQSGEEEQLIFIESKIGSGLSGDDQLQVYARILSSMAAAHRTLLFITIDYSPQEEGFVRPCMSGKPPSPDRMAYGPRCSADEASKVTFIEFNFKGPKLEVSATSAASRP
jgi:hypothetical protein